MILPSAFQPPLSAYQGEQGLTLAAVLESRVRAEPLNAVATGLFLLAILHTFAAPKSLAWARRLHGEAKAAVAADILGSGSSASACFHINLAIRLARILGCQAAYFTFVFLLSIMGAHFPSGPCSSIVNV